MRPRSPPPIWARSRGKPSRSEDLACELRRTRTWLRRIPMRLRFLFPVLGLSSLVAVACSEGDGTSSGGDGGAGGEPAAGAGGEGPAPTEAGSGGEEMGAG